MKRWSVDDRFTEAVRSPKIIASSDLKWYSLRAVSPHSHDFYQLDYFYSGKGWAVIKEKRFRVTAGDLFVSNPGDRHEFTADEKRPLQGVTFKFTLPDQGFVFPNRPANLLAFSHSRRIELEGYLRKASEEANQSDRLSETIASTSLALFLMVLLRSLSDSSVLAAEAQGDDALDRVVRYIKQHYNKSITLDDLARVAGLNSRYLSHKFSRVHGVSPMRAVTKERISAAARMLENTRLPISEIAVRVGYPDVYHFSKRFKQVVGVSPTAHRMQRWNLDPRPPEFRT